MWKVDIDPRERQAAREEEQQPSPTLRDSREDARAMQEGDSPEDARAVKEGDSPEDARAAQEGDRREDARAEWDRGSPAALEMATPRRRLMVEEDDGPTTETDAAREIALLKQQLVQMKRESDASLAAIREELRVAREGTEIARAQPRIPVSYPRVLPCEDAEDDVDMPVQNPSRRVVLVSRPGEHESAPTTTGRTRDEQQTVPPSPQPTAPSRTHAQVVAGSPVREDSPESVPAANQQSQINGALALLDRQVRTMQDTLKCVERLGGSSSSDSSDRLHQLRSKSPPRTSRVAAKRGGQGSTSTLISTSSDTTPAVSEDASSRTESLHEVKEQLVEIANAYRAPPVEITPFRGEVMDFPRFREEVRAGIEATIPPNKGRLARLLTALRAEPRQMCSNLHLFGDQQGYKVAMERLSKKYGHLPSLVNRWKEKLITSKGRTCQDWHLELQGCMDALRASGAERMMGRGQELKGIVEHLPERARRAFAARVATAEDSGHDLPGMEDLLAIVAREASLEAAEAPYKPRSAKPTSAPRSRLHRPRMDSPLVYQSKVVEVPVPKDRPRCPACSRPHKLTSCQEFDRLTRYEKRRMVREAGLCYRCLEAGHRSAECSTDVTCGLCGKGHVDALHTDQEQRGETGWRGRDNKRRRSPPRRRDSNGPPAAKKGRTQHTTARQGPQKAGRQPEAVAVHTTTGTPH